MMFQPTLKIYKDCSEITVFDFMMCISKKQLSFLISNREDFEETQVERFVSENSNKLNKVLKSISEEYKSLVFDRKELIKQQAYAELLKLETKHNVITKILSIYEESEEIEVLKLLNDLKIKFDEKKSIPPQLAKARAVAYGLKNQLNIKTINFKKKYKLTDKDLEEEEEDLTSSVYKQLDNQAFILEQNLETGYPIDIKKITLLRWVNMKTANRDKIERARTNE